MLGRYKTGFIVLMIILVFGSTIAWGETIDNPSDWAKLEVENAIKNGLVPNELIKEYTRPITRGEYTLIALRLLESSGQTIEISETEPFTDVKGHEFEQQLIRAYNAGIIDGYGNALFKPNNKITREEIAALMVKLLQQISPGKKTMANESYEFIDNDDISEWAKGYIDYCYENNILRGVSELEINPKGHATIEQSIVLLNRLANKENIPDKPFKAINVIENIDKKKEIKISNSKNEFVSNFDSNVFEVITELSEKDNIDLTDFQARGATLFINDNGIINIVKSKYEITLYTSTLDLDDGLFISSVEDILEVLDNEKDFKRVFNNSVRTLEDDLTINISEKIGPKDSFNGNTDIIKSEDDKEYVKYNFNFYDTIE